MIRPAAALLFLALGMLLAAAPAGAACDPGVLDLRQGETEVRFRVEVVDTPADRARGLMFREDMPRFAGMLFVYDRPQPVSFWMKNTLIPLDMLFAGPDGVVRRIHENAVPGDVTGIPGGEGIQYVLEINGGLAAELGLAPGAEFRHPSIPPAAAAWPCPAGE